MMDGVEKVGSAPRADRGGGNGGGDGGRGATALPVRKRLDHRGPLSVDVAGAWYFITICAEGHCSWVVPKGANGRAVAPRLAAPSGCFAGGYPRPPQSARGADPTNGALHFDVIAEVILREARENHTRGIWRLALFLVMPDHLHFIVHVPNCGDGGDGGRVYPPAKQPEGAAMRGATALPKIVANFKHLLSTRYGLRFQRDFWDTRLRDDAHYAEKFRYVCNNPVRKGLCAVARDWPYVIAFDRCSGEERPHRGGRGVGGRGATALPTGVDSGGRGATALPSEEEGE